MLESSCGGTIEVRASTERQIGFMPKKKTLLVVSTKSRPGILRQGTFYCGVHMDQIKKAIEIYEELRKCKYHIKIENGIEFDLLFGKQNFHHLIGLQHLVDKPRIAEPLEPQKKFYNNLAGSEELQKEIYSSHKYDSISERVENFHRLVNILQAGEAKIIVSFDPEKTPTQMIEAEFMLYERGYNPFDKNAEPLYYHLFMDFETPSRYCPITFIVEHSNMYMNSQEFLNCSITQVPLESRAKKKQHRKSNKQQGK